MIIPGHNNNATIPVQCTESNRVGKFNLLDAVIAEQPELVQALLATCKVLVDEPHESGRGRFILAASPLFQELVEGEEIPQYRIEAVRDGCFEDAEKEARRVNSGLYGFIAVRQIIVRAPAIGVHTHLH
jgi:hypothetical protein